MAGCCVITRGDWGGELGGSARAWRRKVGLSTSRGRAAGTGLLYTPVCELYATGFGLAGRQRGLGCAP